MKTPRPPKWAIKFLQWFCREDLRDAVLGDLEELYARRYKILGKRRADCLFVWSTILFIRPFAFRKKTKSSTFNHFIMFQHYIKISWRNLVRNKSYSILNISGLTVGITCSILILLWVQNELSYDHFHSHAQDIYRLNAIAGGGEFKAAISPAGMVEGLKAEIPEIHSTVRVGRFDLRTALFDIDGQKYVEDDIFYADSNFLDFFNFPLVSGDKSTALQTPNGVLLTESTAKKYFGDQEALGQTILKDNQDICIVTGILADVPSNSHLQYSMILPMAILAKTHDDLISKTWDNFGFYSYIRFHEAVISSDDKLSEINNKVNDVYQTHSDNEIAFRLQPLVDIHLNPNQQFDVAGHGNKQYVSAFFLVAIFILAVACINFMNLATARSAGRAQEVGLRKVVGARRRELIFQFISESMVISLISLCFAVCLVYLLLPAFNEISEKMLVLHFGDMKLWMGLLIITLFTGLFSGSYPAFFLSSFQPVQVFRGKMNLKGGKQWFRNGLVVTQFVVSIVLLVGTIIVYSQLNFIKHKNLGFDKSNLLYFPIAGDLKSKIPAFESLMAENPLTQEFSITSEIPTSLNTGALDIDWEGKDPNINIVIPNMFIDEHFMDVFDVEVLSGRDFSKEYSTDKVDFILNETAIKLMSMTLENAIGQNIHFQGREGSIVGVIKDFNFKPLQYEIEPLVLEWLGQAGGYGYNYATVRVPANRVEATIAAVESVHKSLNPEFPLVYNFFDEDLDRMYKGEQQMGAIFNLFAILAIFISCLGLYGLSAFIAEQRTKEIGIRKILGASTSSLIDLLSRDFIKLVLIAFLVAAPLSWYLMNEWLKDFAYRVEISWIVFAISAASILLLTLLTVSHQVIKAASRNPVNSLRAE